MTDRRARWKEEVLRRWACCLRLLYCDSLASSPPSSTSRAGGAASGTGGFIASDPVVRGGPAYNTMYIGCAERAISLEAAGKPA